MHDSMIITGYETTNVTPVLTFNSIHKITERKDFFFFLKLENKLNY